MPLKTGTFKFRKIYGLRYYADLKFTDNKLMKSFQFAVNINFSGFSPTRWLSGKEYYFHDVYAYEDQIQFPPASGNLLDNYWSVPRFSGTFLLLQRVHVSSWLPDFQRFQNVQYPKEYRRAAPESFF